MARRASRQRVSTTTIARFHTYSRAIERLVEDGATKVSSEQLGHLSGTSAALVRSDLLTLGFRGVRGVGYRCNELVDGMARVLGLERLRDITIVGAGRLGGALASYLARGARGLRVAAIYDADVKKVGTKIGGIEIRSSELLADESLSDVVVVIATPESSAQHVTDQVVAAGAKSILNFAPIGLDVPPKVVVRSVDVAGELYVLSFLRDRLPSR